jgi:hypothetical protein
MKKQPDSKAEPVEKPKPSPCTCGCGHEGDCMHEHNRKVYDQPSRHRHYEGFLMVV